MLYVYLIHLTLYPVKLVYLMYSSTLEHLAWEVVTLYL